MKKFFIVMSLGLLALLFLTGCGHHKGSLHKFTDEPLPGPDEAQEDKSVMDDIDTSNFVHTDGMTIEDTEGSDWFDSEEGSDLSSQVRIQADYEYEEDESQDKEGESIMDEMDTGGQFVGLTGEKPDFLFEQMMELSADEILAMESIKVPALNAGNITLFLYPTAGASEVEKHGSGIEECWHDYYVGKLLSLELEWTWSKLGDCRPSGYEVIVEVSGTQLLRWRQTWQAGFTEKE